MIHNITAPSAVTTCSNVIFGIDSVQYFLLALVHLWPRMPTASEGNIISSIIIETIRTVRAQHLITLTTLQVGNLAACNFKANRANTVAGRGLTVSMKGYIPGHA